MNNDLHNNVVVKRVIAPIAIGANATKTGAIIDRQGYGGVQFLASYGAVTTTGTVCTLVVMEGDVTGSLTSVADEDLFGTEAAASLLAAATRTDDVSKNVVKKLGYKGSKRYVQVNAVGSGVTSVGCVAVNAILFNPSLVPTA
jgi:hypothetical protein